MADLRDRLKDQESRAAQAERLQRIAERWRRSLCAHVSGVVTELERLAAEAREEADNGSLEIGAARASALAAAYEHAVFLLTGDATCSYLKQDFQPVPKGGDADASGSEEPECPDVAGGALDDGSGPDSLAWQIARAVFPRWGTFNSRGRRRRARRVERALHEVGILPQLSEEACEHCLGTGQKLVEPTAAGPAGCSRRPTIRSGQMRGRQDRVAAKGWVCMGCATLSEKPGACNGQRGVDHSLNIRAAVYFDSAVSPLIARVEEAITKLQQPARNQEPDAVSVHLQRALATFKGEES